MNDVAHPEIDEAQLEAQHLIAQIVDHTGLTPSEVARRAGISPSTLTRIYPTSTVKYTLSARTLAKLSAAFPQVNQRGGATPPRASGSAGPIAEYAFVSLRNAGAGAQSFELEMFEGDLQQPDGARKLMSAPDLDRYFLSYMPSDCMDPRIRAGEVLIVDRVLPPAIASDVILQVGGDDAADGDLICVGQLMERSRERISVSQLQNGAVSQFARDDVQAIYAIVGRVDRALVG